MTTKEAIAYVKNMGHEADNWTAPIAVEMVIDALLASRKRERDVFERLSPKCGSRDARGMCWNFQKTKHGKCFRRTCPLLAKQKKESK